MRVARRDTRFIERSAFIAVLEQKSFTRAAKQLGLSPSRVSELMRGLEESLRVRLVERTTRSVAATAAGERLLARLRPELYEYEAALDSVKDLRAKPEGLLVQDHRGHQATVIHCQLQSLVGSLLASLGRAMVVVA